MWCGEINLITAILRGQSVDVPCCAPCAVDGMEGWRRRGVALRNCWGFGAAEGILPRRQFLIFEDRSSRRKFEPTVNLSEKL